MTRRLVACLTLAWFTAVVVGCSDTKPSGTLPTHTPVPGPKGDGKNKKFGPTDEIQAPPK